MNVNDAFYHGIREQIRRVITALGDERTDKGLSAFEDGSHNWSDCFFARALRDEVDLNNCGNPEIEVARALGLTSTGTQSGFNLVPVRIVYFTFDGASSMITAAQLKRFIQDVRDESRPREVMQLLRSLDFAGVEDKPVFVGSGPTCQV